MARILFGVMGDAFGHVSRALAIAQDMSRHEFLFLGGGKVLNLEKMGYHVEAVPMPSTYYLNNRVHVKATFQNGLKVIFGRNRTLNKVQRIIQQFDPDLILTDYEFFSPIAARRLGIRCISIDHQHFLTKCLFHPPKGQTLSRLMLTVPLRYMFSNADHYLITAFFQLPVKTPEDSEIFPPILRQEVKEVVPKKGDHVLVYQTSPTFFRLLPVLEQMHCPCMIYGFGEHLPSKNLVFKGHSSRGFLEDLAACRYVIANGGHNVISEALFFGKPIFSFPIHLAYEQFFNAYMIKALGFGDYSLAPHPDPKAFQAFEKHLERFEAKIVGGDFSGNKKLVGRLEEIIRK
jgi:uncharacterized protein (TIGR00661 family)